MGGVVKRPGESPSTDLNCSVGNGELLQVFRGSNMFHLYMYACMLLSHVCFIQEFLKA